MILLRATSSTRILREVAVRMLPLLAFHSPQRFVKDYSKKVRLSSSSLPFFADVFTPLTCRLTSI